MKSFLLRIVAVFLVVLLSTSFFPTQASASLSRAALIKTFDRISKSTTLANPSIVLIDRATGEIVFEKNPTSARKPASVMKLLSAAVALQYLDADARFQTTLSLSATPRTVILSGHFDPWMTSRHVDAVEQKRVSVSTLGNKVVTKITALEHVAPKSMTVLYQGVYSTDIVALSRYLKSRGVTAKFKEVTSGEATKLSIEKFATVSSPKVRDMVEYALLWSDNLLANRLALEASTVMGFSRTKPGVAQAFKTFLTDMNIDTSGLEVKDGAGLSKANRVTAEMVADLLLKVRGDADFAPLYEGLPVSGISGTLEDRYLTTAPQAVGLVRAKTGTLDGTVSLAGYVEAGAHEYIFVALADRIKKGFAATNSARTTLDRLLGSIAAPLTTKS
ncbi:MAG: D-alanyl-D-alanine carboxypeptidase [Actinomycetota bacterium]